MTIFIGIDPGVHNAGVAIVNDGTLCAAMWARADGTKAALADHVADAVLRALPEPVLRAREYAATRDVIVGIEYPELTHGRARGSADTSDVMELAYAVGRIEEALRRELFYAHVCRVRVSTWKRSVSTDVLAARLELPPPVGLTPDERASIIWPAPSYRHNVVDAIAIARWLSDWPVKNTSKKLNDFTLL